MNFEKRMVAYLHNDEIGTYSYGSQHYMDTKRISMTNSLIIGYGLFSEMDVYKSREATVEEVL